MNILFCGDHNAEKGVLIATLSLLKQEKTENLHIFVMTMTARSLTKDYLPFSEHAADYIRSLLKSQNLNNTLELIDCTENFEQEPPTINMGTRFTPYAMLRLFADQFPQIPDRILYLDDDVIVRKPLNKFYVQNLDNTELVGVLDYFGKVFFHNHKQKRIFDYLNSGVLLLNMKEIKRTGLFKKVRHLMQVRKMFLPDQTAINKLATEKRIAPRRYNEQYKLQKDTVIQHFTTSFRFFPYFRTQTVKPWDVERVHSVLKLHEYDDILNKYLELKDNL